MYQRLSVVIGSLALLAVVGVAGGCSRQDGGLPVIGRGSQDATLVLRNGKIMTVDESKPEAEALAIRGDRIIAVGSFADVERFIGGRTEVIDLEGQLAVPGFIEGHGHLMGIGAALVGLRLQDARTWDEIVQLVAAAVEDAEPGEWIIGRGWHQEKWDRVPSPQVQGYPTHASLSAVSPENPVLLTHASGHASFVNAKALEEAGITRGTPDPDGGQIVRGANGEATGVLLQNAQGPARAAREQALERRSAEQREQDARAELTLAIEECLRHGVTTLQDAGSTFAVIDRFQRFAEERRLRMRLWVMIREGNEGLAANLADYRLDNLGDNRLTVRAIKRAIDGALGSRGAWLLQPYSDQRDTSGFNTTPLDYLRETARLAIEHDFQLAVHAIGDRGNRETLNIFEETFQAHPDKTDLRWRIEHAQHLHPEDIPRFQQLGVIASMQGNHATSDGPWVPQRVGQQRAREGAYAWRSLLDSGAIVTNGTDAPVEPIDPIISYYASVTRLLADGTPFFPEQAMTREEALRSYTLSVAYAGFEENDKGSLEVGKLADVVVLSQDILTVPDEELLETVVTRTIVGGEVVYTRETPPAEEIGALRERRLAQLRPYLAAERDARNGQPAGQAPACCAAG